MVKGSHVGRYLPTNIQIMSGSMVGCIPVPLSVLIRNVDRESSILDRESPVSIPKEGILSPVYLIHLSGIISEHPL